VSATKYRLVTRSDFDGLVCAVLLKKLNLLEDILFVHPKDVADGKVDITKSDITTNLPYNPKCYLAFDHHESEALRFGDEVPENFILDHNADSAARVVYRHFGGREKFTDVSGAMMTAVDKADAARFVEEEVMRPTGWVLLSFLMDPRTGLGRFRNFRISNYVLMMDLIDYCIDHSVDEILALPDVRERVELYYDHGEKAIEQIIRCSTVHDNLVVLDLRNENVIHPCNRFMVYALHPRCNISIHVLWGRKGQNTVLAIGNSIINRSSKTNIGQLTLEKGGGGHANAGTIQVENEQAEAMLAAVIQEITEQDHPAEDQGSQEQAPGEALDEGSIESSLLEDESSLALLDGATRQDILEIHERLDRMEKTVAELALTAVRG